jgi:glutaredoxin
VSSAALPGAWLATSFAAVYRRRTVGRVVLYTRAGCPYSQRLRVRLEAEGNQIEEVDLVATPQAMTEFLKLTNGKSIVPVLVRGAVVEVAPEGGTEF